MLKFKGKNRKEWVAKKEVAALNKINFRKEVRKKIEKLIKEDIDDVVLFGAHIGAYTGNKTRYDYLRVSAKMLREKQSLINQVKLMSLIKSILAAYKRNGFKKKELAEELADILIIKLRKTKHVDIESQCVSLIISLARRTKNLSPNTLKKIKKSLKRVSKKKHKYGTGQHAETFLNEFFK